MGNLLSSKLSAPLSRPPSDHKRKQRGSSVTSSASGNKPATDASGANKTQNASSKSQFGSSSKPRRASLKMTIRRAYSGVSASSNVLTDDRRHIVQVTWKEITDKTGKVQSAVGIFRILFRSCPELKKVFNVDSISSSELDTSAAFLRHAGVFANILDLAVRNVFELETEVGPILVMFGRRHFYKHQLGFRNEYLAQFAQSMSDFVAANMSESFAHNPEAMAAWRLFISYIIHKVKEGYDLECMQARKNSAVLY